jgi:hypothetical protein
MIICVGEAKTARARSASSSRPISRCSGRVSKTDEERTIRCSGRRRMMSPVRTLL